MFVKPLLLAAFAQFLSAQTPLEPVTCRLLRPGDPARPDQYDETIYTTGLPAESGEQTTRYAFVRNDGAVLTLTREEFAKRPDLRELDGVSYFTFQHAAPAEFVIEQGIVVGANAGLLSASPREVLRGGLGARGLSLLAPGLKLWAACSLSMRNP